MGKKLTTEKQVKKALKINNFNEMSKDKFKMFTSLLPNMDKELAMAIIDQFPSYADAAKCMIEQLTQTCDEVIKNNTETQNQVFEGYKMVLESFSDLLTKDYISEEERDRITDKMILVADKMAELDDKNKAFLLDGILKHKGTIIGGALFLGAAILGVTDKKK